MTHTLSIDPGLKTGYAHSGGPHGVWQFAGHAHPGGPASALIDEILAMHREREFSKIITEGGFTGNFKGKPALEAMRAAVQIAAFRLGSIPVRVVAPTSLKLYAVGDGRADKALVIRACIDRLGIVPADDNESDSIWMLHMARVNKPALKIIRPKNAKKAGKRKPVDHKPSSTEATGRDR